SYNELPAAASWMAERSTAAVAGAWDYFPTLSPCTLFCRSKDSPATLLLTSSRDDRVQPGHARKTFAKMQEAGKDVRYYENIEGGHGGAADNRQAAHMDALYLSFLWQQLGRR